MSIENDQKRFFDQYAAQHRKQEPVNQFFFDLAAAELFGGFRWLSGSGSVLDYGCGTGETIDLFLATVPEAPQKLVGIDLSEVSVEVARTRYPHEFHVVPDNDLSFLPAASLDAVYMVGVLHHTHNHEKIFAQIARTLRPGGKFLILDLTKSNPFIELARAMFPYMPKRVKRMFPDDLVVDETIPEKLRVDADETLERVRQAGFAIEAVEYGHLFYFLFDWLERVSRLRVSDTRARRFYLWVHGFEKWLLRARFFQRRAHVFVVRALRAT